MIKFTAFVVIVALRIMYQPSPAQKDIAPFANPSPLPTTTISAPAKLISIDGSIKNNKVILNWEVGDNETADQFEVEKVRMEKLYHGNALFSGPINPKLISTSFMKAGSHRVLYRIKLINKDRKTEYSTVVEINPNV